MGRAASQVWWVQGSPLWGRFLPERRGDGLEAWHVPLTPRTNKTLGEEPGGGGMGHLSLLCCHRHWCGSQERRCEGRYKDRGLTSWRRHHIWPGLLREGPWGLEQNLGLALPDGALSSGPRALEIPPTGYLGVLKVSSLLRCGVRPRPTVRKGSTDLMSAFLNQRLVGCLDLLNLMPRS